MAEPWSTESDRLYEKARSMIDKEMLNLVLFGTREELAEILETLRLAPPMRFVIQEEP